MIFIMTFSVGVIFGFGICAVLSVAKEGYRFREDTKETAMKPIRNKDTGMRYSSMYECPKCGRGFQGTGIAKYCYHCGQKLDWGDFL